MRRMTILEHLMNYLPEHKENWRKAQLEKSRKKFAYRKRNRKEGVLKIP